MDFAWPKCGLHGLSSLAGVLEVYVNIPQELRDDLPILRAVRISIPDDARAWQVRKRRLAVFIGGPDPIVASRRIGDGWMTGTTYLCFRCRQYWCRKRPILILNPAHPRMREVKIVSTRAFHFDPRLVVRRAEPHHSPFFSHLSSGIGSPIWKENACTCMWSAWSRRERELDTTGPCS